MQPASDVLPGLVRIDPAVISRGPEIVAGLGYALAYPTGLQIGLMLRK